MHIARSGHQRIRNGEQVRQDGGGSPGPDVHDVDLGHGVDDHGSSVGGHQRDQRGCDDRVHDGECRHRCRVRQCGDRECGGAGNGRRRGDSDEPGGRGALPEETDSNYTVHLKGQPAGPVVVRVASDDDGTAGAFQDLMFSTTTWNTGQAITVIAVHDPDGQDKAVTITHAVRAGSSSTPPWTSSSQ